MRAIAQTKATLACLLLLCMAGCNTLRNTGRADDPDDVAQTFRKVAERVYWGDWIGYDEPVTQAFTPEELDILARHRPTLQGMLEAALGRQRTSDSVWGAKLAGHFRVSEVLPSLRRRFLTRRRPYGWEGSESLLTDYQYQYSVAYLEAIEAVTGKSIAEAVRLTPSEHEEIQEYATNPDSMFYHWALWTQRKLGIE